MGLQSLVAFKVRVGFLQRLAGLLQILPGQYGRSRVQRGSELGLLHYGRSGCLLVSSLSCISVAHRAKPSILPRLLPKLFKNLIDL